MSITIVIIIITCIISFMAFSSHDLIDKLIFYPPSITDKNQWYRFFTCGLIHADIGHLAFNMISLLLFGKLVEQDFAAIFGDKAQALYLVLYVTALAVCLIPTYMRHKHDYQYRSLGASGAVSAVVFVGIFLDPLQKIGLFVLPPIIPGYIFGPLYLIITAYLDKRGQSGINHSAHLWGALYGLAFIIVMGFVLANVNLIEYFIDQVKNS